MSLTTDSSERREARWPITLGGLYYGVLPKASHGELCPSPFVVIGLEPALYVGHTLRPRSKPHRQL